MAAQLEAGKNFRFQRVQIFKSHSLGVGSYGTVYKGRLDQLPCAGKLLHKSLYRSKVAGFEKDFEKDCLLLSNVRHPNIVQYLGTVIDRETGLPVLLMELMDENLTHFLERSHTPLPHHVEVNICQDISLAIAYLHLHGIIHHDLTGNNVLLVANSRAKVSDFGMSMIRSSNNRPCSSKTKVYLSPEALTDPPMYSNKLDCFSIGVLAIQIMTRKFPNPGPAFIAAEASQKTKGKAQVLVDETERRKSHIALIDLAHPLLAVALRCLCHGEKERPSATELCREFASLKESPQYAKSIQQSEKHNQSMEIKDKEIAELQKQVKLQASLVDDLQGKMQMRLEQREIGSQMQEKIAYTEKEIELLQQENDHLRKENLQVKKQKQQLRQENLEMKQDNQQIQQENEQLKFDLEDVTAEVQQREATVSGQERDIKQVRHRLQEKIELVAKREEEIQELKQQVLEKEHVKDKPGKIASEQQDYKARCKESVPAKETQPMKAADSDESKEEKPLQQSKRLSKRLSTEFQTSSASQKRSQFAVQFQQSLTEREKDFQVSITPKVQPPHQQPVVRKEGTPTRTAKQSTSTSQERPEHNSTSITTAKLEPGESTPTSTAKPEFKSTPTSPAKPPRKRAPTRPPSKEPAGKADRMRLVWSTSEKAPCQMSRGSSTVEGSTTYLRPSGSNVVHTYDFENEEWSQVPECPLEYFNLAVLKGQLTAIGGKLAGKPTNFLLSLTLVGSVRTWSEHFPPMPTKRYYTATVHNSQTLVVAGGIGDNGRLNLIEVMDMEMLQWSSVANIPHALSLASATICGENLYILGGLDEFGNATKSVLTCSLSALIESHQTSSQDKVWYKIADTPVYETTCATFCGRLVTFGGRSMDYNLSAAVYMYNPEMNTWNVTSEMMVARYRCLVAVLPAEGEKNKVIVVGGHSSFGVTNATEIASVV